MFGLRAGRRNISGHLRPGVTTDDELLLLGQLYFDPRAPASASNWQEFYSATRFDKPTPDQPPKRFEHYELVAREDGKSLELGRGAMGVTYKAFDINLRCPVTLKAISERYLGDESARLRFLREARAAASVRHPNVASVFHLGKTGSSYFYAMEGETLDRLITRFVRLDVKLVLEIATQVAAGLAGNGRCDTGSRG